MKKKTILSKTEQTLSNSPVKGENKNPNSSPLRGGWEGSFNGIPYSVIVNALLAQFGFADGNVPIGARNTTLYRLARQLRYICDFNPAYIRSVVPDWGLGEEEIAQTISSAINSTRATNMPYELKQAIDGIQKPDLSTPAKRQEYLQRLNPLPRTMPKLLRYIYT